MAEGLFETGQRSTSIQKFQGLDPDILQILHNPDANDSFMVRHDPGLHDAIVDERIAQLLRTPAPTFSPSPPPAYVHIPRQSRWQHPPQPPEGWGSASVTDKLRIASGLPDGPIIPNTVVEFAGAAYDLCTSNKPRLLAGTAVIVAGSILGGTTVGSGITSASKEVVAALERPAMVAPAGATPKAAVQPAVADVVEVTFSYTPQSKTTPKEIANVMQASSREIAEQNAAAITDGMIDVGTVVGGTVKASKVTLAAPVGVDQFAKAYGLNRESVLAVNTPNEHGLLIGEAFIPGRSVVQLGDTAAVTPETVATTLALTEVGTRELKRVNQNAPAGQLVLPLSTTVQENLPVVAQLATSTNIPAPVTSTTSTITSTTVAEVPVTSAVPEPVVETVVTTVPQPDAPTVQSPPPEAVVQPVAVETPPTSVPEAAPMPLPQPVAVERPATPEEKMAADIEAVHQSLEHALATGDLGPLNHLVTNSPVFKGYSLTAKQQAAGMRHLPPANIFGDWLKYEFGHDTPDNERQGNSQLLSFLMYYAYAFQQEVAGNPEWSAYRNACARFNDLTASDGHQTHKVGVNADINSVLVCDIVGGHSSADGPTGWINRSPAISHTIANTNYDFDLDYRLIDRMRQAHIDGQPVLRSFLYNAPNLHIDQVQAHVNHGDHMHATVNGGRDASLAGVAHGGGRPEQNLDDLRAKILLTYLGGEGVEGLSRNLTITEQVLPATPDQPVADVVAQAVTPPAELDQASPVPGEPTPVVEPAAPVDPAQQLLELAAHPTQGMQHALVRTILLNEIAHGEGGYDSTNRGHAGDTQVGDSNYKRIFGDKPLSQHTIAELLELQRNGKIFTIGRYQLIPGTARAAVEATGIDVNRVFDAATQDELAANYLIFMKRPNLTAYIKGDISKEYLAVEDLCKEFASMPCNDGSGNYDGDSAGNRAAGGKARVAWIREILKQLRITYAGAQQEINQQPAAV